MSVQPYFFLCGATIATGIRNSGAVVLRAWILCAIIFFCGDVIPLMLPLYLSALYGCLF